MHIRGKWYEVNGNKTKCACTGIEYVSKDLAKLWLVEILPPHNKYWYNPETKQKLQP